MSPLMRLLTPPCLARTQRTVVRTVAGAAFGGIVGTLLMRKRPSPPDSDSMFIDQCSWSLDLHAHCYFFYCYLSLSCTSPK